MWYSFTFYMQIRLSLLNNSNINFWGLNSETKLLEHYLRNHYWTEHGIIPELFE